MIFDKGEAGLFPFHDYPTRGRKKTKSQLIGGSKVRLKECRENGRFLVASQVQTIVESELADRGEMASCRNREGGSSGGVCLVRVPGDGGGMTRVQ